jgi:hypothetical protein
MHGHSGGTYHVKKTPRFIILLALLGLSLPLLAVQPPLEQVFGDHPYDPALTTPDRLLGFAHGTRAASAEEIDRAVRLWGEESPRVLVQDYGTTHQGRPLRVAFVSSPANLARLDAIRADLGALADPRQLDAARASAIIDSAPAVGYLAYSIHGNETSGADAALGLVYHLAASRDPAVEALLERTIIIVDPLMNPDGRARAVADLRGFGGATPNVDGQHLGRGASWPFGRGNHYVFDLNRDSIYGTQPETRGRLGLLRDWHPLLFVDAHEMGAQDTFLFSPAREPVNKHFSQRFRALGQRFSDDQAAAFDQRGWVYYSGEWNEGWYPGYADAWAGLRGAVNILYEQARVADHGVRQSNQLVLDYREGVARQLGSSWANIESLARYQRELLTAFWEDRRAAVSADSPYATRMFVLQTGSQPSREAALLELLALQNIEVYRSTQPLRLGAATDLSGRRSEVQIAAGTLLIPNRQPLARLVAALFEFDPRIDSGALAREREELLRTGQGTLYDVTAWNLPMMYGLQAYTATAALPASAERALPVTRKAENGPAPSAVGYLIPGHDDGALPAAAALLRAGIRPRLALKPLQFDGRNYPRGSLVITRYDHRNLDDARLREAIATASVHLHQAVVPLGTGTGPGDLPDLGGGEFSLLEPPRVAVLAQGNMIDPSAFGSIWHYLDRVLELSPTLLSEARTSQADLRAYNVIVLPERRGALPEGTAAALKTWVEQGGTLIASGSSAALLADKDGPLKTRTLPATFEELAPYRERLAREWLATQSANQVPADLWSHTATAGSTAAWPATLEESKDETKQAEPRDRWRSLFMPRGAMLAARCDTRHWLTMGCDGLLPVLAGTDQPLMVGHGGEAAIRYGWLESTGAREAAEWRGFGWGAIPPGQQLYLRMGGLLWPEAQERLANSVWLASESVGRGQVILFAGAPEFRGSALGMRRMLGNAVIYGPGAGTQAAILP